MLSAKRERRAAQRLFGKVFRATHNQLLRVINVDKNAAYPKAIDKLKAEEILTETCEVRQNKYLNNPIQPDQQFSKRLINPALGLKSFRTAKGNN